MKRWMLRELPPFGLAALFGALAGLLHIHIFWALALAFIPVVLFGCWWRFILFPDQREGK